VLVAHDCNKTLETMVQMSGKSNKARLGWNYLKP
jgi:hypothetical protein